MSISLPLIRRAAKVAYDTKNKTFGDDLVFLGAQELGRVPLLRQPNAVSRLNTLIILQTGS